MLTKPLIKKIILLGLAFGIFFGVGTGLASLFNHYTKIPATTKEEEKAAIEGERTNILLLGVDAREGEKHSRADTIILASIDPDLNKVALVSIPRDTRVNIGGSSDKICVANYYGGPRYTKKVVESLLDTTVDYYVEMDFKGFKKIVDTLGGVNINVPCRMYKPSEDIDLKPGQKKLDGRGALAFVRYRGYTQGDIQRTAMQQTFIKALAAEVLQAKTIPRLPKLIRELNDYVDTDMKISDALRLAGWAAGFESDSVIAQTLPGSFYDIRDQWGNLTGSYWVADTGKAKGLLDTMFSGRTVAVVEGVQTESNPVPDDSEAAETEGPTSGNASPGKKYERANLPSPGHDLINSPQPEEPETQPNPTGPEGYI